MTLLYFYFCLLVEFFLPLPFCLFAFISFLFLVYVFEHILPHTTHHTFYTHTFFLFPFLPLPLPFCTFGWTLVGQLVYTFLFLVPLFCLCLLPRFTFYFILVLFIYFYFTHTFLFYFISCSALHTRITGLYMPPFATRDCYGTCSHTYSVLVTFGLVLWFRRWFRVAFWPTLLHILPLRFPPPVHHIVATLPAFTFCHTHTRTTHAHTTRTRTAMRAL